MNEHRLLEELKQLHDELQQADSVDEEARELLDSLSKDIQNLIGSGAEAGIEGHSALQKRLLVVGERFEESHPQLVSLARNISDMLSNLGI